VHDGTYGLFISLRLIAFSQFHPGIEKKATNPINPACPVKFEDHFSGACPVKLTKVRVKRISLGRNSGAKIASKLGLSEKSVSRCLPRSSGRWYWGIERGKKLLLYRLPRRWEPSYWGEMPFSFIFHWYLCRETTLSS